MTEIERRYALTKVAASDYLLPSNDGGHLYRVATYREDGSAETWDGRVIRGEFWGVWRWTGGGPQQFVNATTDSLDWGEWTMVDSGLRTRREAIQEALRIG